MDSDTLWHYIDQEREALCAVLTQLDEDQWASHSLCERWSVRDVAAHLSQAQLRLHQVVMPALRARFRMNNMICTTATSCSRTHEQIIETIRGFHGSRRCPPFVSEKEPLADVLVHTQDICVPLGLSHPVPPEPAVVALERLLELNRTWLRLRPPLDGVRLIATDADWASGTGPPVEGPLAWLLMLGAGRDVARAHLSGALGSV